MRQAVDFEEDHSSERYQEFLLWFMRTLGLVFLVAGLVYWKPLVGLVDSPDRAFLGWSTARIAPFWPCRGPIRSRS